MSTGAHDSPASTTRMMNIPSQSGPAKGTDRDSAASLYCGTCHVSLDNLAEMRAHAKSQLHVDSLRRRMVEGDPDAHRQKSYVDFTEHDSQVDDESDTSDELASESEGSDKPDFVPEDCLFCNHASPDFGENLTHMQKAHGLSIPDESRLLVDKETLVAYLNLVIRGYNECISCGALKRNVHAIQEHMKDRGHCKFEISDPNSEYAEFYDATETDTIEATDGTMRLGPWRIAETRSAAQQHRARQASAKSELPDATTPCETSESTSLIGTSGSAALTHSGKRAVAVETQLARLSVNDQRVLAHLPSSEQRAVLATQKKQVDRATRVERRMQSRVEALGNRTLMKHFKNDVPGRVLG